MQLSNNITDLAKALALAQAELTNPYNTADNPFFKSKYAPLPDILNLVRPVLTKHGISVVQSPVGEGDKIGIETLLIHASGQYILCEPCYLKPVKSDPQTAGGAITYARRYALNAVLGISGEEDDDGNGASKKNDTAQSPPPPTKQQLPFVSKEQRQELVNLAKSKWPDNAIERFTEYTKYASTHKVPLDKFEEVKKIIQDAPPF